MGVGLARGVIGCRLATLGFLAVAGPVALQAQVGLTSGTVQVALMARVPPRAAVNAVSVLRETGRAGASREGSVKVSLSANTGYRLLVVGTAPVRSAAEPASRLWVRAENGQFEEITSGRAVTVLRGHHAVAGSEPELNFRTEGSEFAEGATALPVRYEVRIDPAI